MKTAQVTIKGVAPVCQSRFHNTPKQDKETADAYEQRTWREKAHYDREGNAYIPGKAFKFALATTARKLGIQVPGRGKKTYKDSFASGILIMENLPLGVNREQVECVPVHCDARGIGTCKGGGGSRVMRYFPIFHEWGGTLTVHVTDDLITEEVFEHHFREAGKFTGVGQNRPENCGEHGRFDVVKIVWK
jgi:hypothetical protein